MTPPPSATATMDAAGSFPVGVDAAPPRDSQANIDILAATRGTTWHYWALLFVAVCGVVQAAALLDDPSHGHSRSLLLGGIDSRSQVLRPQLGGSAHGHVTIDVEHGHPRPFARQTPRDARADAPSTPGHDRHPVLESHGRPPPSAGARIELIAQHPRSTAQR